MRYFDTSILAPLFVPEPSSDAVERLIRNLPLQELATSHLTRAEFTSSLSRRVRMRELTPDAAASADAQFEEIMRSSFTILSPGPADFDLCKRYLSRHETGLRTADALHLAIAANNGATAIYSLDAGLRKAGRMLSLPITSGLPT